MGVIVILLLVALGIVVGYAAWQRRELRVLRSEVEDLRVENTDLENAHQKRVAELEAPYLEQIETLRRENAVLSASNRSHEFSLEMVLHEMDKPA